MKCISNELNLDHARRFGGYHQRKSTDRQQDSFHVKALITRTLIGGDVALFVLVSLRVVATSLMASFPYLQLMATPAATIEVGQLSRFRQ